MNILVIGSGGREHAIVKKLKESKKVSKVFVCPKNPYISELGADIAVDCIDELIQYAKENNIDLTVVGPEVPLVLGIVDKFEKENLRILGVNHECAKFEGSKHFTKQFLNKYNIKTAKSETFYSYDDAILNIGIYGYPTVIKADGLAAGKGVIIAQNAQEAKLALKEIFINKAFGETFVVIEQFLTGTEASIICFVDNDTIIPLETAQDYKKAYDNDEGPNTGGMGTYSPSFAVNDELKATIYNEILVKTLNGFKAEKLDYRGILFVGVMIEENVPYVLEFNVRFGDPETQVILPRLKSDLVDIFNAIIDNNLAKTEVLWSDKQAVCVVLASGGYPSSYKKDIEINLCENTNNTYILHAGTGVLNDRLVTKGGRVLNVVSVDESIDKARENVYNMVKNVQFEGKIFRKDIALKKECF